MTFSHVEESGPRSSSSTSSSSSSPAANGTVDRLKVLRTTEVLMINNSIINNSRSLSPHLALNEEGKEKNQRDERKRTKTGKAPRKEQDEDDTIFREGMQKMQEQTGRITGVLKSTVVVMPKKFGKI